MDETGINLDMPGNWTIDDKGAKHVSLKTNNNEKTRISCPITISMYGSLLPSFVILKGQGKKRLIKKIPDNIIIAYAGKDRPSWMT